MKQEKKIELLKQLKQSKKFPEIIFTHGSDHEKLKGQIQQVDPENDLISLETSVFGAKYTTYRSISKNTGISQIN